MTAVAFSVIFCFGLGFGGSGLVNITADRITNRPTAQNATECIEVHRIMFCRDTCRRSIAKQPKVTEKKEIMAMAS